MVNFILQYPLLEDKTEKPYECVWCGDNFGGHKRKYCTPKCREEEIKYDANKRKLERQRKRQVKKIHEEELNRKKRIAALDKELAKLREENRKLSCVVCDKELTGKQTLYCSDECKDLTRYDDNKRITSPMSVFNTGGRWHEGHYGKCNLDIIESKNSLLAIDLEPYTYESDYYIEKCIIEDLPPPNYTDGRAHNPKIHKGQEYYYGPNYSERVFHKSRKKEAVRKLTKVLKQRIKQLEDGEREEPMVVNAD